MNFEGIRVGSAPTSRSRFKLTKHCCCIGKGAIGLGKIGHRRSGPTIKRTVAHRVVRGRVVLVGHTGVGRIHGSRCPSSPC